MLVSLKQFECRPLVFVDLDGTFVLSDTLWESLLALIKTKPLYLFFIPLWIIRGKAAFKKEIARNVSISPEDLPYSKAVAEYVEYARSAGSTIILATAAHYNTANKIAEYFGIFSEVLATGDDINLKSKAKAEAIIRRAGNIPFDYIGNAAADLPVWKAAGRAVVANPSFFIGKKVAANFEALFLKDERGGLFWALLKEIRAYQWAKNLLIFLPPLLAHKINFEILENNFLAFIAFSLCASGVYLINDLLDVTSDRSHPTKNKRPFASGELPLWSGALLFPVFFAISWMIASSLPTDFRAALTIYAVTTTIYSLYIKRIPLLDALVLASLYSLRLHAGAAASSVQISQWLAVFSIFVFLSLAFVKRYTELLKSASKIGALHGRGYRVADADMIASFGSASGYISVLVIGLYCYSPEIKELYSAPELLLTAGGLHLYWISRIWLLAHRGELDDDPILFALRDPISYIIAALAIIIFWIAV